MATQTQYVLQSTIDGHYLPFAYTWTEVQVALRTHVFCVVRRLDEVLAGW